MGDGNSVDDNIKSVGLEFSWDFRVLSLYIINIHIKGTIYQQFQPEEF